MNVTGPYVKGNKNASEIKLGAKMEDWRSQCTSFGVKESPVYLEQVFIFS